MLWNVNRKSRGVSVCVGSDDQLSGLERREAMNQISGDLLNNACTVCRRTTKFGRITYVGRGVFLGVSHSPALPNFEGSIVYMQIPFDAELPNFTWGGCLFLGVSHASTPRG